MANNSKEEPATAPHPDRWYNLTLGSSFNNDSSNKFCTLRYEFKPASIDKTKPGSLKKTKENRVNVEFQNNQLGKQNVTFVGSSEDYKDNDAVLFFDGESFRLERLHRAVKQLRHLRQPGESASAASTASSQPGPVSEARLSPVAKAAKTIPLNRSSVPPVPVEVERIDVGEPENPGAKSNGKGLAIVADHSSYPPNISTASPGHKNDDYEEHQDIDIDELFGIVSPEDTHAGEEKAEGGFNMSTPRQKETDDEIADVDDSGDEEDKGPNAAEALRAQVNAETREESSSSSSSSGSGSGSSGSGSGSGSSSSSDAEGSDEDSVTSI